MEENDEGTKKRMVGGYNPLQKFAATFISANGIDGGMYTTSVNGHTLVLSNEDLGLKRGDG
eukprot:2551639-Amphidinium_carterae.1